MPIPARTKVFENPFFFRIALRDRVNSTKFEI